MKNKCLYCYEGLVSGNDFHNKCALEFFGTSNPPSLEYTLDQMDELAKSVIERRISVPGMQPKLSLSLIKATREKPDTRLTVVGALGGMYILKPPSTKFAEMPQNEHLTMRMAEAFGIRVAPSSLIRLSSGELSYITRRIDRTQKGEKIHMLDMYQITEAIDKYRSSLERTGRALGEHSANPKLDKILFLELVLFSFLTGNSDMHLKNFSMIESESGWVLAPAYDLLNVAIIFPEDNEELALTLAGKKRNLKLFDFEQLGSGLGLSHKQISGAFSRMAMHKTTAHNQVDRSFLSNTMKTAYRKTLDARYKQLGW